MGAAIVSEDLRLFSKHHGFRPVKTFKEGQEIRFLFQPRIFSENYGYQLGYVHGAFAGDESIIDTKTTRNATIRCQDPEIIDTVDEYAPSHYGLEKKAKTTDDLCEIRTTIWSEVEQLEKVHPVDPDMTNNPDYIRGWLSGMFDTDGGFDGNTVRFTQKKGAQREILQEFIGKLDYNYEVEKGGVRVSGPKSRFEIMNEISPKVLRKVQNHTGHGWKGTAEVESVEEIGDLILSGISVSGSGTLVIEGFCSRDH